MIHRLSAFLSFEKKPDFCSQAFISLCLEWQHKSAKITFSLTTHILHQSYWWGILFIHLREINDSLMTVEYMISHLTRELVDGLFNVENAGGRVNK